MIRNVSHEQIHVETIEPANLIVTRLTHDNVPTQVIMGVLDAENYIEASESLEHVS